MRTPSVFNPLNSVTDKAVTGPAAGAMLGSAISSTTLTLMGRLSGELPDLAAVLPFGLGTHERVRGNQVPCLEKNG